MLEVKNGFTSSSLKIYECRQMSFYYACMVIICVVFYFKETII